MIVGLLDGGIAGIGGIGGKLAVVIVARRARPERLGNHLAAGLGYGRRLPHRLGH
jgi:hypothetical protein